MQRIQFKQLDRWQYQYLDTVLDLAVPVLRYSFGIVNWHLEELQKLDRKTRKLLTLHGQHHPKADVDRFYVPRKHGGRGLMQLEAAHAVEITKLMEYVDRKEYPLIQVVRTHHTTQTQQCYRQLDASRQK